MSKRSLEVILANLHALIQKDLEIARQSLEHSGTKGDASEIVWLEILNRYLPTRYSAMKAHVVDSRGAFSDQMDVVVYDRQYSPPIFSHAGQAIITAESVYAVFEVKQTLNARNVEYARKKAASVRQLHRTSLPIPHAGGTHPPRQPISILGGLLALESDWKPALGEPLLRALGSGKEDDRLDLGCVAAGGYFGFDEDSEKYTVHAGGKPATAFLFELISRLQSRGTVQMIDMQAYARWLSG